MNLNKLFMLLGVALIASSCSLLDDDNGAPVFSLLQPPQLPSGVSSFSPCDDDGEDISQSLLPTSVLDYIADQFPGWEIDDVERYEQNGQVFYGLELEQGSDEIDILFAADGTYISHGSDNDDDQYVPLNQLPQEILDYIATNFPDYIPKEAEIETEYGQSFYEVEIKKPGTDCELDLYFDGNNVFICYEDDCDDHDDDDCDDDDN